jgi:hypothetical protein
MVMGDWCRDRQDCEVRNKLKITYRPSFQVQDLKPEHEAMRYTFVKQIQDWRRAGVIKYLIFSDESRFCRRPDRLGSGMCWKCLVDCHYHPSEVSAWRDGLRCNRGGIQESDHSLFEGVNSAEYVGMVL